MRASRFLGLAAAVAAVSLVASAPALANCGGGLAIFLGFSGTGYFQNCGDDVNSARVFFWEQHFASQKNGGANTTALGAAGIDSGALNGVSDALLAPYDTTGGGGTPTPGAYQAGLGADWGAFGPDACPFLKLEPDTGGCPLGGTTTSLPVTNWVTAGRDAAAPLVARSVVVSVDGNELYQFYILDNAGTPNVDSDPCGANPNQFGGPYTCGTIPPPQITGSTGCDATGCNLSVSVGAHSVPFIDDCNVARSAAIDCPRNLYVGRQIFIKRAPCNATAAGNVGTFDTRTFVMDSTAAANQITPGFFPYAPQDLNLNGVQDGTETAFTPVILAGNATTPTTIHIPKIALATDCAYLGVALVMDSAPDATSCGGACQSVVTPLVTANGAPISLDNATPVADKVIDLVASKSSGKASVSWDTSAELQTAGFNLIGTKKNGGEVQLNSSLIQAKQGTTGNGASYSVGLSSGDLKGSTAVYVEVVKTNGAKERFGPASF